MTFDPSTIAMLKTGIWETFYMVFLSSLFAYVIGLPLGIVLVVTDSDGIHPVPWLQKTLGTVINLLRSVPFLILLFIVPPLSKIVIGTRIGSPAMVIPLTIAAGPYVARVVESSCGRSTAESSRRPSPWGLPTGRLYGRFFSPSAGPPSW